MKALHRDKHRSLLFLGRFTLLFSAALCAPALLGSTIQCQIGTYADYQSQGQCMIGDFTLFGFTFSSSSIPAQDSAGAPILLSPVQIVVDPTGSSDTSLSLRFSATGGFNVDAGQFGEYIFGYQIDPVLPLIDAQAIDLGPNDPVTLTGEFCGNGTLVSAPGIVPVSCTGSNPSGIFPARLQISGPSATPQSQSFLFPAPVTTEDLRLILVLDGRNTTTGAHVGYFGSETSVASGGITIIPEPSTAMFTLLGALALLSPSLRNRLTINDRKPG
jgi:hypothetical protein